jgi:hypothetical protein
LEVDVDVDGLLETAEDAVFFLLDVLIFFSWREELDGCERFILHYNILSYGDINAALQSMLSVQLLLLAISLVVGLGER